MQQDLELQIPIGEPRHEALEFDEYRAPKPVIERPRREARAGREAPNGRSSKSERPARSERPSRSERPTPVARPATSPLPQPVPAADGEESVYVANLPWEVTADDIGTLFADYGEVHQTTIIIDRRTGRSKGFGFVDMPRPAARSAIEALHGSTLGGRDITVRFAQPRRYYD